MPYPLMTICWTRARTASNDPLLMAASCSSQAVARVQGQGCRAQAKAGGASQGQEDGGEARARGKATFDCVVRQGQGGWQGSQRAAGARTRNNTLYRARHTSAHHARPPLTLASTSLSGKTPLISTTPSGVIVLPYRDAADCRNVMPFRMSPWATRSTCSSQTIAPPTLAAHMHDVRGSERSARRHLACTPLPQTSHLPPLGMALATHLLERVIRRLHPLAGADGAQAAEHRRLVQRLETELGATGSDGLNDAAGRQGGSGKRRNDGDGPQQAGCCHRSTAAFASLQPAAAHRDT